MEQFAYSGQQFICMRTGSCGSCGLSVGPILELRWAACFAAFVLAFFS